MQRLDLVKYLADTASELIARNMQGENADLDEAAELLNLSARIMARTSEVVGEDLIQEAA